LGITPGCQLDVILEGNALRVEVKRRIWRIHPEDGYGLLVCKQPGKRRLSDFVVKKWGTGPTKIGILCSAKKQKKRTP
jgi:hypothetical protein